MSLVGPWLGIVQLNPEGLSEANMSALRKMWGSNFGKGAQDIPLSSATYFFMILLAL